MQTTYISHSGFLVETNTCYFIFDYYKGSLPTLNPQKPILVFASHGHGDHYNPIIFDLLQAGGMVSVTAVLSYDIPKEKYPENILCITVTSHQIYSLPFDITLETLKSTDEGVAFVIKCEEGTIYHAGDLNDWVWEEESPAYNEEMTKYYRKEIDLLKDAAIDVAFIPLDPRQEKDYARGILYFLENMNVKQVYPMHYWEQPEIMDQFLKEYPEFRDIVIKTE